MIRRRPRAALLPYATLYRAWAGNRRRFVVQHNHLEHAGIAGVAAGVGGGAADRDAALGEGRPVGRRAAHGLARTAVGARRARVIERRRARAPRGDARDVGLA